MLQCPSKITGLLKQIVLPLTCQTRNTMILKRRNRYELSKKGRGARPKSNRHYIYELVEDTNLKPQDNIEVILTKYVAGLGNAGDIVSARPTQAYNELLLPGLAIYKTPENLEQYKNVQTYEKEYSSQYVQKTMEALSSRIVQLTMSKTQPWVIEPWHISACYRKMQFVVPPYAIEMPPKEISGPNLTLQGKEFLITITINQTEKVRARCRIHHWEMGENRLPHEYNHWAKRVDAVFPEQAEELSKMPLFGEETQNQ